MTHMHHPKMGYWESNLESHKEEIMAINMQGSWTVSVKSKSAAFEQRFIISGADTGNGTYPHTTPPVYVTGDSWTITIQHDPGTGWIESEDQIKFPTISAGQYTFDIESNDTGPDEDFNDLILTCSTLQTETDFLIYGHVSYYGGWCLLNPCAWGWVVIDTALALAKAVKNPHLRLIIEKLYPERLITDPPSPGPQPDPPPFRPLVIPIHEQTALPPKLGQVLRVRRTASPKSEAAEAEAVTTSVTTLRQVQLARAETAALLDVDRLALASIFDRWIPSCTTGPLPGVVLKFQEYDRTSAELAGGAYFGDGNREDLGVCVTDRNGNYIFRFSRTIAEFFEEAAVDLAPGEDVVVQSMPDVIVQVLDPMVPTGVAYESAPFWNIPLFKRIDICVPEENIKPGLKPCHEGLIIQGIGNIFIGPPQPDGSRVGFNNSLGADGRITARNTLGPQTRCAAWAGILDFYACLTNEAIKWYTIRYKKPGETSWKFYQQEYLHPRVENVAVPGYNGDPVGPLPVGLKVDGGPKTTVKAYKNISIEPGWVSMHIHRKAKIRSASYEAGVPGPVQFRIEGYRANGNKFPGADDTITLYIDNTWPTRRIDENITMGSQTLGNCALFTLPTSQEGAPLTVKFKVDQAQGFLKSYELYMYKGTTGYFAVLPPAYPQASPPQPTPPYRARTYEHGDDLLCNQLRGTFDDSTADLVTGYVTINITPDSGHWLEPTQTFCAFSVNLVCTTRVTNGLHGFGPYHATPVLIGIERP